MTKSQSSAYIEQQRRDYSLYVMRSRAIPDVRDGLKAGGRRALWTGRDGSKYKTATLAGATMPLHPHAECSEAISKLAAPYGNNIPLFVGKGAFGTLINPSAYGAGRYTTVSTSKFTNDVLFRDIEIVPMMENYDGSILEPIHFLPLIPVCLLNPAKGIAIGYATSILPRALDDLIIGQITHLKGGKSISDPIPKFNPLTTEAYHLEVQSNGNTAYYFNGEVVRKDTSTCTITKLPYGQTHSEVIAKLDDLLESGNVVDYTDNSKNVINILVKFKRIFLRDLSDVELYKMLGLSVRHIENLNVLDFTGQAIWSTTPANIIRKFTDWRLEWYVPRYERLRDLLQHDLQKLYDVRCAIKHKFTNIVTKAQGRDELKEFLTVIKVVNLDYIADLPVHRFTEEGRLKNEEKIAAGEAQMTVYLNLLGSEQLRKDMYASELKEVLLKYNKGQYNE